MMKPQSPFPILSILAGLSCLVLGAYLVMTWWYIPMSIKNEEMRREILALEDRIAQEKEIARRLGEDLDALRNDPETVERMAREVLMLARPGELVVRIDDGDR